MEEIQKLLEKLFPGAFIDTVENFDDVYYGFEVSTRIGEIIVVGLRDDKYIKIEMFTVTHYNQKVTKRKIYGGPKNIDLIKVLLENRYNIG